MLRKSFVAVAVMVGGLVLSGEWASVSANDDDPPQVMPTVEFETGGVEAAYSRAIEEQKPLVIMFTHRHADGPCHHERQLLSEIYSPEFGIGGDEAIFVICCVDDPNGGVIDEVAKELAERLEVSTYPAISVLAPNSQMIEELVRLNGLFSAADLTHHLRRAFDRLAA